MKDTIKKLLENSTMFDVYHTERLRQALSRCAEIIYVYEEALDHANAAMGYAYEDHLDQYYKNVQKIIDEALAKAKSIAGGEKS